MDMYETLARRVVYPLGDAVLRTNVLRYLASLEKTQWWSVDKLVELQNRKLRSLIHHVYKEVPYYRRVFDERGLSVQDIRSVHDLPKLPVLTKDLIRQNLPDLMPRDAQKWRPRLYSSSGSTGEPLRYYTSMDALAMATASTFRGQGWAGYRLGEKMAVLGGSSVVSPNTPSLRVRLRLAAERVVELSAAHMTEDRMASYVDRIARYRPLFIRGYPTALYVLADYLRSKSLHLCGIKAVFTTAEMLLPEHRQAIESQFTCSVFDEYGCNDGGVQGYECTMHRGLHITAEKVIVESVDPDTQPGVVGSPADILATDLHNYAMPFLRYSVGDRAVLSGSPCPCGRGLPLIAALEGRTTDILRFDNGTVLSGMAMIAGIFKDCHARQYQVVQTGGSALLVNVVKGQGYTQADTALITRGIRSRVGSDVEIAVQYVDNIATTRAGKHRFVIADMSNV